METQNSTYTSESTPWVIAGLAAGAAIGIGYVLATRRRRSRWDVARSFAETVAENREDYVDAGRHVVEHLQVMVDEGKAILEELQPLWSKTKRRTGMRVLRPF